VNGAAVEDVPICFDDNYLQSLVDRATARGIPPEEPLVVMSLGAFQRNLVRRNGPEEMGGEGGEQGMKVEVVTSVDDYLGCEELLFSPATTTADEAVRHRFPHDTQRETAGVCETKGSFADDHDTRVRAQDMKVEVITSVNDSLGCEELSFPPTTTTLQQVADEAVRHGLPYHIQRVILMPTSVFTTDDIEALKTKLKAGLTEYDADHKDDVKTIHGFLPPIKQEKIKELCESLKLLEKQLAESGALDETKFEELQRNVRQKLRTEIQHAKVFHARQGPPMTQDSRVMVQKGEEGKFYPARVTDCAAEHSYHIAYDDGESELSVTQDRITRTQTDLQVLLNPLTMESASFIFEGLCCPTCHYQLVDMCQTPESHTCCECRLCIPSTVFKRCEQCDYDLCSSFCTVSLCLLRENATSSIVFPTHRHTTFVVKLYTISDPDIARSTCPFITRFASPKPPP
jgi:hypothetical protein